MKPKPVRQTQQPEYPDRRRFIRHVGLVAAGAGLAAVALPSVLADPPPLAGTPPVRPKPEKEKDGKKAVFCAETFGKDVDKLAKQLGSDDFKVRKQATAKLIAFGKGDGKNKAVDAKRKAIVIQKMNALQQAKDPEVAQRAKEIVLALTPEKKVRAVPERPIQLKGDVAIEVR